MCLRMQEMRWRPGLRPAPRWGILRRSPRPQGASALWASPCLTPCLFVWVCPPFLKILEPPVVCVCVVQGRHIHKIVKQCLKKYDSDMDKHSILLKPKHSTPPPQLKSHFYLKISYKKDTNVRQGILLKIVLECTKLHDFHSIFQNFPGVHAPGPP